MKKHHIFSIIVAIVTIVIVGCTPTDNLLGSSPQRMPLNGDASDRIISPEEAMALVVEEAWRNKLWGLPSIPTCKSVETVIIEDILNDYDMLDNDTVNLLIEDGIMKLSDPAYYIINFNEGGYAMVLPNRKMEVGIVHVQNYDSDNDGITSYAPSTLDDVDGNGFKDHNPFGWVSDEDFNRAQKIRWLYYEITEYFKKKQGSENEWDNDFPTGGGTTIFRREEVSEWTAIDSSVINTTFYPKAEEFNEPGMDQLGRCWQVLFSFLGYWEAPNTIFGVEGDWRAIKSDITTKPAPHWAMEMSDYCKEQFISGHYFESPRRMASFLANECSGVYTNVSRKQYSFDANTGYTSISPILQAGKPVIVVVNGEPFLAVKEVISKRTIDVYHNNRPFYSGEEYKSEITLRRGEKRSDINSKVLDKIVYYIDYNY